MLSTRLIFACAFSVSAVTPDHVVYTKRTADGKIEEHTVRSNFVLWSTGIAMNPFAKRVTDLVPNQVHKRAIETDAHLRVKGAPLGTIYAIGDCATVRQVCSTTCGRWNLNNVRSRLRLLATSWNLSKTQTRTETEKSTSRNGSKLVRRVRPHFFFSR